MGTSNKEFPMGPNPNIQQTNPPYNNFSNDEDFEIADDDFLEDSISHVHSDDEL
jgi:hypothetical protein